MGFSTIIGRECSTSRPIGKRRTSAMTGRLARGEPGRPFTQRSAHSRHKPFLVLACALIIAVFAASCGGDDTSGGDTPDSVETSDIQGGADVDDGDVDPDTTTSTVIEPKPAPNFENDVFANAYGAARDAYAAYSSARHDGYFAALYNVSSVADEAAAARAAALADVTAAFGAAESQSLQVRRNALNELQGRRDAASAEVQSHRDEVNGVLDAALQEALFDGTDAYQVWYKIGETRADDASGLNYFTSNTIANSGAKIARRLAFNETYLATIDAAIGDVSHADVLTALIAAWDAAAATVAANPLLYENADTTIDAGIAAALAGADRGASAKNFEARIDAVVGYDIVAPATEAGSAALDEVAAADAASLEQVLAGGEELATVAYDEAVADATADREAAVATADRAYERTVAAIADAVGDARSAFDFDAWVSAAFALADAYVVLHDVAVAAESEAQVNDDGSLAAASVIEYASTVRKELAAVADSANLLLNRYPRRTVRDVEAEFAEAAEALLLEAEFFEDALDAARSRAEARAKALNG